MNGNECRYWVVLSYFLGVLATLESVARLKHIIVCRLNDTTVFAVHCGKKFPWWNLESCCTKIPDSQSTVFCSVELFFWSLLAVTDQGRILSGSVVVGVCMCIHILMESSTSPTLCCKNNLKVSPPPPPPPPKHLRANSREMEKHKSGMQKAEVFMHKPEGKKMFLKEKQKKNVMMTLNCLH